MLKPAFTLEKIWDFSSRTVIVTGGARGIGAAICRLLAHLGARISFTYFSATDEAERLKNELESQTQIFVQKLDVRDPKSVEAYVQRVHQQFGPIHGLVNNASHASAKGWNQPFTAIDPDAVRQTLETDIMGSWTMTRAVVPFMPDGEAAIVNLASAAAWIGDAETAMYSPAKMGIVGFTRSLARLLAPGIRVNAVAPGSVQTHWLETWHLSRSDIEHLKDSVLLKRLVAPEEIAWAVAFLLSKAARSVTGQTWVIDAGMTFH